MTVDTGIRMPYIVTTIILVVAGLVLGPILLTSSTITQTPVEGIAAFAILYVLAQAIERVNQLLVPVLDRLLSAVSGAPTATDKKRTALTAVREQAAAMRGFGVSAYSADAQSEADEAVTTANIEKALLTNGLAFLLAMLLVGLFKFSLLASLGYTNVPSVVDIVITATAIMGGSAGLGDLISKIQKSKTADETAV
ncbi:MAG: hypothetical protein P0Y48_07615 [Candidatus Microbacterium phytovorans]|uniref:Uncharacterized protein n=1 Tax=Candidatus Microbacterium phytovorans TaxID=3121374 RepID=A0AAJ6B2W2_9MICO|nr:hypothetical protein [Microbacterium sp.]WEK12352.1 MAG: hypothetical protein P0Y48_07615 [Microbacterium sp.]